jgi:recombination protein RecA
MATRGRPKKVPADGAVPAVGKEEKSEVSQVIAAMHKRYGPAVVTRASEQRQPWRIPTNVFSFDLATCGGIPHNRMTMFHGPRSSGKSTMSEKVITGAQQSMPHLQVCHIDVEGTRDTTWGGKLGTNNDALIYVKPEQGEHAVDIAEAMVRTKEISLVVVDSLAAMTPGKEIEASAEDNHVGLQSRLISSMVRKLNSALIAERNRGHFVSVLFINQQRSKIGGYAGPGQEALSLPGGKALEFFTTLQARFKNKETISRDSHGFETTEFNEHAFKLDKNKMNAGLRDGEYQLMRRESDKFPLNEGDIDDAPSMLAHAKKIGCYMGGGSSWKLDIPDFEYTFRNADEAILYLYENREIYHLLRCHLIASHAARLGLPQDFINYLYGDV